MRLSLLAAAAILALAACKNNDQHDNSVNVDENLTAENIVSNDVTAIDAVTGDAANMAADVNYTEEANLTGNEAGTIAPSSTVRSRPSHEAAPPAKSRAAATTSTNSTTETTNTAD